jgi:hypothetical protein
MNATFIRRITPPRLSNTTRKTFRVPPSPVALAAFALGAGGCATPGPLHVYTLPASLSAGIHDAGSDATTAEVPSFLDEGDTLIGFAYDPFTDHFFLRLAPGDRFRVVDRPARAVKREFTVASLVTKSGGDLAIRPRDGHVFATHPTEPAVVEFNRFGEVIRTVPLATLNAPPSALAYDVARDQLLALSGGDLNRITVHDTTGKRLAGYALDRDVKLTVLAYDSERRELYTLLAREPALGIFDEQGHLLRSQPLSSSPPPAFLDLGPRSFLRLF